MRSIQKIILFILLLTFTVSGVAQTGGLKNTEILINLAESYRNIDPDSAILYGKIALEECSQSGNKELMARSQRSLGITYFYQGEFNRSLECLDSGLVLYQISGNQKGIANCLNTKALVYQKWAEYDSSLRLLEQSLHIRESLDDKEDIAISYLNLGNTYFYKSNFVSALNYYFKAVVSYQELGLKTDMADVYINIGVVYKQLENYEKAITYLNFAERIYNENNAQMGLSRVYSNKAEIYNFDLNRYDEALDLYQKALKIKKQFNNPSEIALMYNNIGTVYGNMAQYGTAFEMFEKSRKIYQQGGDIAGLIMVDYNMGKVKQAEDKFSEAGKFLEKSLEEALKHDYQEYIGSNEEALFQCYAALHDMKKFNKYYRLYSMGVDSLIEQYNQTQILQVESGQKIKELEQENRDMESRVALLKEKAHNYRITAWGLAAIFVVVFIVFIFIGNRNIS